MPDLMLYDYCVECGSSVVECRTRNRESPDSNPSLLVSKFGYFRSLHETPVHSAVEMSTWLDIGGNANDLVIARNCCMARMLPGEAELVSEGTGLPGKAKSVKRFERSNGLNTALYKDIPFLLLLSLTSVWTDVGDRHEVVERGEADCRPLDRHHHLDHVLSGQLLPGHTLDLSRGT